MRSTIIFLFVALLSVPSFTQTDRVTIRVDAAKGKGPMKPIWSFFGYDEPNYTYMKDGKKLLSELAALSPAPVYVRAHNLLTTGDGTAALKWGSTNAYTEDASGKPRYDWTIVDRIIRHLYRTWNEAAGRDRIYARSALGQTAAVPARMGD